MRWQCNDAPRTIRPMTDERDAALETATTRAREAEERFLATPAGSEASVELAGEVERRAEDVDVLADEVAHAVDEDPPPPSSSPSDFAA
jgi:hypothetical protein